MLELSYVKNYCLAFRLNPKMLATFMTLLSEFTELPKSSLKKKNQDVKRKTKKHIKPSMAEAENVVGVKARHV